MFVYSMRLSSVKMIALCLALVVVVGLIVLSGQGDSVAASAAVEVDYSGVKDKESRVEFISRFGIEVDPATESEQAFRMPSDFDRVIAGYNELQKRQGLDLLKYKNKRVTRYTYRVTNYSGADEVYANLFIYRGKVVACDVSSADPTGFVTPLTLVDPSCLK